MYNPIRMIAWRRLRNVDLPRQESDSGELTSNQHELQGIRALVDVLGVPVGDEKRRQHARWVLHGPGEGERTEDISQVTWYDARASNPKRSAEYRLYYERHTGLGAANADDLLLMLQLQAEAAMHGPQLVFHILPKGTSLHDQVLWALELSDGSARVETRSGASLDPDSLPFSRLQVIFDLDPALERAAFRQSDERLVAEVASAFSSFLADPVGGEFPRTRALAEFAQHLVPWRPEHPDASLEEALRVETVAFAHLEEASLRERLRTPFADVDDFVSFSLSVQNRRKARRGKSLEHHLEWAFNSRGLRFQTQVRADDGGSSVDFLFPSLGVYQKATAPILAGVVALAAKSTCKDRWRQVLVEARKIPHKHLFTLETAISSAQTREMAEHGVSLVVPESAISSFVDPGTMIHSLGGFMEYVEAYV